MIRRLRTLPVMVALATLMVPGCMPYQRVPNPPTVRTAPDTGTGLEPIYGEWQVDKPTPAYAQPAGGAGVIATLGAGQAVTALGRVRNSDWVAVKVGGATAYVRLHLLSLKGNTPRGSRGTSTTVAKPADNAGPAIKAAPRGKIGATPIAN